jgi:D-alanyl-lipoteichoic acid acyltransferase DltB (MBOAT superfamily)
MLFSSHEFIFYFLPLCIAGVGLGRHFGHVVSLSVLLGFSLLFYGVFHPPYLAILLGSINVNYFGAEMARRTRSRWALGLLILFNIGLLGVYKYADLAIATSNALLGSQFEMLRLVLPLAISFFTFQQIAYVVDRFRGDLEQMPLLHYAVFVAFFPQLIAGPIVRCQYVARDLMDHGVRMSSGRFNWGLSLFILGLAKKVLLADSLANIADPVFDANASGEAPSQTMAWLGLLAYSLQIYFDFSAYSDMAIGLGIVFGLSLPVNFLSPYKSRNIIEFWRRWHISLSDFLRDYLYFPLGGNRKGPSRRMVNLMLVMLIGGLWHGADWAFMLWGGIHGSLLVLNHIMLDRVQGAPRLPSPVATVLTFLLVTLAWVPFRANGLDWIPFYQSLFLGTWDSAVPAAALLLVLLGLVVVFILPNSMEIFNHRDARHPLPAYDGVVRWRASSAWLALTSILCLASILLILDGEPNEFIYFQF